MQSRQFVRLRGAVMMLAVAAFFVHATFSYHSRRRVSLGSARFPATPIATPTMFPAMDPSSSAPPIRTARVLRLPFMHSVGHPPAAWSIGDLSGGNVQSDAVGVSADGSVIVGSSSSTRSYSGNPFYDEPFRWTGSGMPTTGLFIELCEFLWKSQWCVGRRIGRRGISINTNGNAAPFRWTQSGGMVNLGTLTNYPAINQNEASDVSANGSIVVGFSTTATGRTAFRWSSGTGMQSLGALPARRWRPRIAQLCGCHFCRRHDHCGKRILLKRHRGVSLGRAREEWLDWEICPAAFLAAVRPTYRQTGQSSSVKERGLSAEKPFAGTSFTEFNRSKTYSSQAVFRLARVGSFIRRLVYRTTAKLSSDMVSVPVTPSKVGWRLFQFQSRPLSR